MALWFGLACGVSGTLTLCLVLIGVLGVGGVALLCTFLALRCGLCGALGVEGGPREGGVLSLLRFVTESSSSDTMLVSGSIATGPSSTGIKIGTSEGVESMTGSCGRALIHVTSLDSTN